MIDKFDLGDIGDRDILLIDLEDDSLRREGILGLGLREEKILNGKREGKGVEKNEENTRIHRKMTRGLVVLESRKNMREMVNALSNYSPTMILVRAI